MKDKDVAIEAIQNLPENATIDEIADELQILAALREAREDVKAERTKSHAEVEILFETWISK